MSTVLTAFLVNELMSPVSMRLQRQAAELNYLGMSIQKVRRVMQTCDPASLAKNKKWEAECRQKFGKCYKSYLPLSLFHLFISISFINGINTMAKKIPGFTDLSAPDTFYILPLVTGLTFWLTRQATTISWTKILFRMKELPWYFLFFIMVQAAVKYEPKDLAPLWSVDLKGKVNGAVETCGETFHRLKSYLNFSDQHVSENFDPEYCGWAYGMNIFDLKEWRKNNITETYHFWQNLNENRTLWKLGTLPPGLITFYNLTLPLQKKWHLLGLGYNREIDTKKIEKSAVIHFNGHSKPWTELGISKYQPYWTKYTNLDHPYISRCRLFE